MNNGFKLQDSKNEHRRKSPNDYVIAVNPLVKSKLNLSSKVIVVRNVTNEITGNIIKLSTICNLIIDNNAGEDFIYIDQSIREALGIAFKFDYETTIIELYPLKISFVNRIRNLLINIFDRRYIFLRVFSGVIYDIEKNVTRSSHLAFDLLGIDLGGKIVLESVTFNEQKKYFEMKFISITLFELPAEWVPKQKNLEALKILRDILPITLDARMREDLGVELLGCVRARRNVLKLFIEEFRTSGIITILTLFTILEILPIELGSWFSIIPNLVYIVIITILLMILNIRSSLK